MSSNKKKLYIETLKKLYIKGVITKEKYEKKIKECK